MAADVGDKKCPKTVVGHFLSPRPVARFRPQKKSRLQSKSAVGSTFAQTPGLDLIQVPFRPFELAYRAETLRSSLVSDAIAFNKGVGGHRNVRRCKGSPRSRCASDPGPRSLSYTQVEIRGLRVVSTHSRARALSVLPHAAERAHAPEKGPACLHARVRAHVCPPCGIPGFAKARHVFRG